METDNNLERELAREIQIKNEQIAEMVEKIKELERRIAFLEAYNYEKYMNYYYSGYNPGYNTPTTGYGSL